MTKRAPKTPKKKNKNLKKTSAAMDAFMAVGPYAQDIINYGMHGLAGVGGALTGRALYKSKKMKDKHDKELGRKRGGAVMKSRGGTFKGTF
tara:strand:- start:163 stop:435 length:273 start_codon:yes stop_codon:yes gene_type:complete